MKKTRAQQIINEEMDRASRIIKEMRGDGDSGFMPVDLGPDPYAPRPPARITPMDEPQMQEPARPKYVAPELSVTPIEEMSDDEAYAELMKLRGMVGYLTNTRFAYKGKEDELIAIADQVADESGLDPDNAREFVMSVKGAGIKVNPLLLPQFWQAYVGAKPLGGFDAAQERLDTLESKFEVQTFMEPRYPGAGREGSIAMKQRKGRQSGKFFGRASEYLEESKSIKPADLKRIVKEEVSRLAEMGEFEGKSGNYISRMSQAAEREIGMARQRSAAADIRDKYRSMAPVSKKAPGRYMLFSGGPLGSNFWNEMIDKDIAAHGMAPGNINLSVDVGSFPAGTNGKYEVTMSGDEEFPYHAEVSIYDNKFNVAAKGDDGGFTPYEAIENAISAAGSYAESERVPGGEMMGEDLAETVIRKWNKAAGLLK
jgi:hypothetical protein